MGRAASSCTVVAVRPGTRNPTRSPRGSHGRPPRGERASPAAGLPRRSLRGFKVALSAASQGRRAATAGKSDGSSPTRVCPPPPTRLSLGAACTDSRRTASPGNRVYVGSRHPGPLETYTPSPFALALTFSPASWPEWDAELSVLLPVTGGSAKRTRRPGRSGGSAGGGARAGARRSLWFRSTEWISAYSRPICAAASADKGMKG